MDKLREDQHFKPISQFSDKTYNKLSDLQSPVSRIMIGETLSDIGSNSKLFSNPMRSSIFEKSEIGSGYKPKFNLISSIDMHEDERISRDKGMKRNNSSINPT